MAKWQGFAMDDGCPWPHSRWLRFRNWWAGLIDPHISNCLRCGIHWRLGIEEHSTRYTEGSGCFPLCTPCWRMLTPEDRLPYYARLVSIWREPSWFCGDAQKYHDEKWELIKAAVEAGK